MDSKTKLSTENTHFFIIKPGILSCTEDDIMRLYTEASYTTFVVSNSTMIEEKKPTSHTQENTHQNGSRFPIHSYFR